MKLPDKAISEFRALWSEAFGEDIDLATAARHAEVMLVILGHAFLPRSASHDPKNNDPP